jgi:tetratricopeptide (TPR) repeat protein
MPGQPGPDEMMRQPLAFDAHLAALSGDPSASGVPAPAEPSHSAVKPLKTGMRKTRSRLQIALWVLVGAAMIGGGVFAGFQIRAMRLGKQIAALRSEAMAIANADTWLGWLGARNRLASVAQASATIGNRAILAHTRAVLAYEFGDGVPEAQAAVADLAGQGGLHGALAAAFLALAQHDAPAARAAADRALALDASSAAALYASSQAALLAGDLAAAIERGKRAVEKEARAMYATGLARAYAAATAWEDGLAATDQALKATPDHPGALIVRGVLLAEGGRVAPGNAPGTEIRGQLEKVVREGTKPVTEQPRGVSPAQVAYADLALARVDAARGNVDAAKADMANALAVGLDEQRFAEEVVETLYSINLLAQCRTAADRALAAWPGSLRARATRAQVSIAQGRPEEALELLGKAKDTAQLAQGLAVRGLARLSSGDLDGARADFDAALQRAPRLEPALIGRASVDLRANKAADAQKRIEPLYKPGATSPGLASAYAQVLYAVGGPASRDKAKVILEKAAGAGALIDAARAQLGFARILRDVGDAPAARAAYEVAMRQGGLEVRLEAALFELEERRPAEGRNAIELLVQEAGERAPALLLLEAARARMLVGDHPGAEAALEQLQKQPDAVPWQLDRERGRYALRRGDTGGAAQLLSRALEACGEDVETFLLAADVANADIKQAKLVDKLRSLTKARLRERPEASIVAGKLALGEDNNAEAETAYEKARAALAKASSRRQAQAEFGRAVVAYYKKDNDALAQNALKLAIVLDPTLYNAYLFYGDLVRDQAPDEAFDYVKKAVAYNPDLVDGWVMYGTIAHVLRKRQELNKAITRVGDLAPGSEPLRQLQSLR